MYSLILAIILIIISVILIYKYGIKELPFALVGFLIAGLNLYKFLTA